ncbi:MAG TPA: hypothetical protein VLA24_03655 [Pseudomonadales bacterium]|nr:hypothetical protein [Pseudomonadales bacterium]
MPIPRLIETHDDLNEGLAFLCQQEPRFQLAHKICEPLELRRQEDGFDRLLSAIVSQQLSVAAARTIWQRVINAGITSPEAIKACDDDSLRQLGLSKQKIGYARSLANANIDFLALRYMSTQEVIDTLIKVKGVGVWTAEIYAMFSLGHADVFAHNDLALQEGTRLLFQLEQRPSLKDMRTIAAQWQPWRAVAARLLWAYYAHCKVTSSTKA